MFRAKDRLTMPITRQVKNVVKNYSNVEVKVREATSNDPWGPSSALMADIADQTYNVVAFSEIMTMIWKRLNDHGKNWRHVYKSLVLLDYIVKTGSERVAQQCRENVFAIQTLKDFQFIDRDGKDQGMNVREKSKQLVALLKDEERLNNERTRALKAKERLSQASGGVGSVKLKPGSSLRESGSASDVRTERGRETTEPTSRSWEPERRTYKSEIEKARPSNPNEEELQLQLALALSKQEADETKHGIAKDEQRFQMAVSESRQSIKPPPQNSLLNIAGSGKPSAHAVDHWGSSGPPPPQAPSDPWGTQPSDPWGSSAPIGSQPAAQPDPWGATATVPPPSGWSGEVTGNPVTKEDPWGSSAPSDAFQPSSDPWAAGSSMPQPAGFDGLSSPASWVGDSVGGEPWNQPVSSSASSDLFTSPPDMWSEAGQQPSNGGPVGMQPFDMTNVGNNLPGNNNPKEKDLLDHHSTLINLDSLGSTNKQSNPFFTPAPQPVKIGNPFSQEKPAAPSLNQLRTNVPPPSQASPSPFADSLLPAPLIPAGSSSGNATSNPFL